MDELDHIGGLSDDQLDRALALSAMDVPASDVEAVRDIVRGARRATEPRQRPLHRWKALALFGTVAAVGLAAAVVPQHLEGSDPFFYRAPAGIRVTWSTSGGSTASCLARFGFEHVTSSQKEKIETYLESHDWRPLNERLERAGAFPDNAYAGSSRADTSKFETALRAAGQAASDAAVGVGAPRVTELSLACGGPE